VTEFDQAVAPGKVGYVNATIDSQSLWGKVSRFVTLYTNDPARPPALLQIDATVIGSVELLPSAQLELSNRTARALLLVRQDPTETGTLELSGVTPSSPWLAVAATRLTEKRLAGDGLPVGRPGDWLVEARLAQPPPRGRTDGAFTFRTGLGREPQVRIPVTVRFEPAIELSGQALALSGSASGELLLSIREGLDPAALAVRTEPAALAARLEPSGARHYKLLVSWNGAPGSGTITLSIAGESYRVPVTSR
jgi:hypothetical protein